MARRTLHDLYDEARTYLDTDDLNFPDPLCHLLMRKVWFQAVNMEREWRFLQDYAYVDVPEGTVRVPLSFTVPGLAGMPVRQAARLLWIAWGDPTAGTWGELTENTTFRKGVAGYADTSGTPAFWSEEADAGVRYLRLFPSVAVAGRLNVTMVLIPEFPEVPDTALVDLPEEFDDALLQGLLGEMYMREEDADLYQFQRSMFMEQMGSIKERWRVSNTTRLVLAGDAITREGRRYDQPRLNADSLWP